MKLSTAKKGVVIAAVLGGALSASVAEAGYKTEYGHCYKNADNSGYCFGTMLGYRNAAGDGWMSFYKVTASNYTYYAMSARVNGQYYSCTPNTQLTGMWHDFMTAHGRVEVEWNASGQCTYGIVDNSSSYSNF
jgi:hypothetical protein